MTQQLKPPEVCEVCGLDVDPVTAIRSDLAASGAMCPSPMVFHPECAELAGTIWQPDESTCIVDPEYPETMQWPRASDPVG